MTKKEILKAIENGESVWFVFNEYSYKNDSIKEIDWMKVEGVELRDNYLQYFNGKNLRGHYYELIFKTKAEAEHYLHHANISRTEHLPFLTWEEFKKERYFGFYTVYDEWIDVYVTNGLDNKMIITIENAETEEFINNYDFDETNFYKAYDECVRLFKEEI